MPSPLTTAINALVSSHSFFTTYMGAGVALDARRLLATKLYLYEVRGRPVNTRAVDLERIDAEYTLFAPRPQLAQAMARLEQSLSRFTSAPYVPGEVILSRPRLFPGVYWGGRYASGTQRPWVRDTIRRYHGQPVTGGPGITAADLARYAELRVRVNDGYANTDRARLIMKYNAPDLPPSLPGFGLVETPFF
jgi:hypothetical protein